MSSCGVYVIGFAILVSSLVCSAEVSSSSYQVPTFTIQDLQSGRRDGDLTEVLVTTGLLAVRVPMNDGFRFPAKKVLNGLCECRNEIEKIPDGQKTLLNDGQTTRSTIATATFGSDRPLSLPANEINQVCSSNGLAGRMESLRDIVSQAAGSNFVPSLDRLIRQSWRNERTMLEVKIGNDYKSMAAIVEDAKHLEHFHVYSKEENDVSNDFVKENDEAVDEALDWHTDAGLFLAFLPAVSCTNDKLDNSFHIKVPSIDERTGRQYDKEVRAVFPNDREGEVIVAIMMGAGAQHWLKTPPGLKLRATKHAVRMKSGEERAWYGMMHLVPQEAIVDQTSGSRITFGEMQKSIHAQKFVGIKDKEEQHNDFAIGCGNFHQPQVSVQSSNVNTTYHPHLEQGISSYRRRLSTVGPQNCNNSTNLFCWMSCREIPSNDNLQNQLKEGNSVYCLSPSVLSETNDLQQAVEACRDPLTGVIGGTHKDTCTNTWRRTKEQVPTYLQGEIIDDDIADEEFENRYCWGETAMNMLGFEWEGNTCIVYLFPSWVISSRGKLVGACFGTVFLGIFVEWIVRQRPHMMKKVESAPAKLAISALFYTAQLVFAYTLMLLIMTYSGPLVLSVILGLVLGHVMCNWDSYLGSNREELKDKRPKATAAGNSTPCCNIETTSYDSFSTNASPSKNKEEPIPSCCGA